jgi:DNA polymerase delta subunit 1
MKFQACSWEARDVEDDYTISIFGRCKDGKSACVTTTFRPYFFVKLPPRASEDSAKRIFDDIKKESPFIQNYEILRSKDLWGFQNNEKSFYMKLNFKTHAQMKMCDRKLQRPLGDDTRPLKVYESNVDPFLRFMHRSGISSTGWLETGDQCTRNHIARVDIDLFCSDWRTLKPDTTQGNAPFVVASFDIETYSSTGEFPDADVRGDEMFQIGITLKRLGETVIYNHTCLCYKQTGDVPGANIVCYTTERELIEGFAEFIKKHDVDIMTGWNIFGFDLEYIFKRAALNRCSSNFYDIGKLRGVQCDMVYKNLSSSALGDNMLKLLPMNGRFIFDLFHEVKREKKLDSYKLDSVAEIYLGDNKLDMPPKEMFASFACGDPTRLAKVAEYCVKDTVLPHRLIDKLCTLLNLIEMAKATWVPLHFLVERGQQIKVFSQLTRKAREMGFMVPTIRYGKMPSDGYVGATVLDAQKGAYYRPITALDFASLYPSIMRAHNLCYSTLVMDPRYDNLPGVEYESFEIPVPDKGLVTYKFAQNVPALLPAILKELSDYRSQAKNDMKAFPEHFDVFNGKQLAYKISSNSVYGFTGAMKGILPCVPIASTVTTRGRQMIEETKTHVESHFPGAHVRYGDTDSVMVEFDTTGMSVEDALEHSWKLGEAAAAQCTKLFKKPNDLELEKVYYPYFLYSKKRYAAKVWTKGKDNKMKMDYIDIKGLQVVRRDGIKFTRDTCKELFDVILESNNPEEAKQLAVQRATELIDGRVPMEKLILSQKLAGSYKGMAKGDGYENVHMAHAQVVSKMKSREPGSEPQSGDRVPYVIVETSDSKARMFEKSEDPVYARDQKVPLDYQYYFTNKFMKPVCDILEPLVDDPKQEIFGGLLPKKTKLPKGQKTMLECFAAYKNN